MPYKSVYVDVSEESLVRDTGQALGPKNPQQFGNYIAQAANKLEAEGYVVVAVTPIIHGTYLQTLKGPSTWSRTVGVTILAKK